MKRTVIELKHDPKAFKVGDKVAVIHKLKYGQSGDQSNKPHIKGYNNSWVNSMNAHLFQTMTVEYINEAGVYFKESEGFGYPSCCCILIADVETVNSQLAVKTQVDVKSKSADKTSFTDQELQYLQRLLKYELNSAQDWLRESKYAMGQLWKKCDPAKAHHSDVQFAYKTYNATKKAQAKVSKCNEIFGIIQNKIKFQLGNKKVVKTEGLE